MLRERLAPPPLAKYFFAVTQSSQAFHDRAEALIREKLGPLDFRSEMFSFSEFSTYYDQEMGGHCWKYLVSLEGLLPADRIVDVKLFTEEIESRFAAEPDHSRKRSVNIDPGFLNGWQVVLASVKNHSHRLYMRAGVYCEVTLLYREKAFRPLPWTYRDYLSPEVQTFLYRVRRNWARRQQLDEDR